MGNELETEGPAPPALLGVSCTVPIDR
jgi:hypothetical protein